MRASKTQFPLKQSRQRPEMNSEIIAWGNAQVGHGVPPLFVMVAQSVARDAQGLAEFQARSDAGGWAVLGRMHEP